MANKTRFGLFAWLRHFLEGDPLRSECSARSTLALFVALAAPADLWKSVNTGLADASQWEAYDSNVVEEAGDFIKITINDNEQGATLRLASISEMPAPVPDYKNYRITFAAYIQNGGAPGEVVVRNMTGWNDVFEPLGANPAKYVVKLPNTHTDRPRIMFANVPVGSTVYISKQIMVERMLDRGYTQPEIPFKGVILDMREPRETSVIEEWFRDLDEVGAGFVRLQVSPTFSMEGLTKDEYIDSILDRVKTRYLPLLRQYGMKAMVCYEGMPYDDPALSDRRNEGYWENPVTFETFKQMAYSLAGGLKDEPEILALQFCAEPVDSNNQTPGNWMEISEAVIQIVRQYTDKFVVWSNGPGGLSRYEKAVPFDDDRIVYNYHNYAPAYYTHQGTSDDYPYGVAYPGSEIMEQAIDSIVAFRDRNNNIPVMCGAYSVVNWAADGDLWMSDFVALLRTNHVPAVQHLFGQYQLWDWRYTATHNGVEGATGPGAAIFVYDKTATNKLWTLLSDYLKE